MGGRIPEHIVERAADVPIISVVEHYVPLKKDGANYKGLCPFHEEKTPSFKIHPDRNFYKCFGCGEGGGVINFLMKIEGLSFTEAVESLCNRFGIPFEKNWAGVTEKKQGYYDIYQYAAEFYQGILIPGNERVSEYLTRQRGISQDKLEELRSRVMGYLTSPRRGLKKETVREWSIGFAINEWDALMGYLMSQHSVTPQQMTDYGLARWNEKKTSQYDFFRDRIMIPIRDRRGQVIAFSGRKNPEADSNKEIPKFINSPDTQFYKKKSVIFALNESTEAIRKQRFVVAVEGYFDAIAAHQENSKNVVALAGTSFTKAYAESISRLTGKVVLCLDPDEAGIKRATEIGVDLIGEGLEILVAPLPDGKDPDEVVLIDNGETFRQIVSMPQHFIDFKMDQIGEIPSHPDEVLSAINPELYLVVNATKFPLLEALYLKHISARFGIKPQTLWNDYRLWRFSRKGVKKNGNDIDWEVAVLSFLAYTPTERRFAASQLSADNFSTPERQVMFDFLTSYDNVDDVLLKPWDMLTDAPLFAASSAEDMGQAVIGHSGQMGIAVNEANLTSLLSQISRISIQNPECVSFLKKQKVNKETKDLENLIRDAERVGDAERMLELTHRLSMLGRQ